LPLEGFVPRYSEGQRRLSKLRAHRKVVNLIAIQIYRRHDADPTKKDKKTEAPRR